MVSDLHQAFGHPELRAAATDQDRPADRISLRDHTVTVEIGAFQQERGTDQRIRFNLVVEVAPHGGAQDDDVDKILSYDTLTDAIAAELAAERLNLLETLADRIALRILGEPRALRCFVRIEKLDRGPGALGVEIVRDRRDLADADGTGAPAQDECNILFLSRAALDSPHLTGWIDDLAGSGAAAILCVEPAADGAPVSDNPLAQRRIDLLAMEQAAWLLAGRDPRCTVVQTRTEIDWAIKNRALTVWAPGKIVLDSVDRPDSGQWGGPALAAWFAGRIGAARLIVIGADLPVPAGVTPLAHAPDAPHLPLS